MKALCEHFYQKKDWEHFLMSLSKLERTILIAIGSNNATPQSLSTKLFNTPQSLSSKCHVLMRENILKRVKQGTYKIVERELAEYCDRLKLSDEINIDLDEAIATIEREIYQAAITRFETLEYLKKIRGNGHHLAQEVAAKAAQLVRERWQ